MRTRRFSPSALSRASQSGVGRVVLAAGRAAAAGSAGVAANGAGAQAGHGHQSERRDAARREFMAAANVHGTSPPVLRGSIGRRYRLDRRPEAAIWKFSFARPRIVAGAGEKVNFPSRACARHALRDSARPVGDLTRMRLPPIDPTALTPAQQAAYDGIAGGARGAVRGPFLALLHSPELARRVEQVGVHVRYQCAVPVRLRELAILVVAQFWRADYEWFAHAPLAEKQGLPRETLEAFGAGGSPEWPTVEDTLLVEFCSQLLRTRRVDELTYARMLDLLGTEGITDLVGLVGYYTLLALTLNAHEVGVPADAGIPWNRVEPAA